MRGCAFGSDAARKQQTRKAGARQVSALRPALAALPEAAQEESVDAIPVADARHSLSHYPLELDELVEVDTIDILPAEIESGLSGSVHDLLAGADAEGPLGLDEVQSIV